MQSFKNLKEMEEFWESHEFTEFQDEFKAVNDLVVEIKKRTFLPITLTMYNKLEKIAIAQNITVDQLIHSWVEEKLAEY
jgi:hypothetical protein